MDEIPISFEHTGKKFKGRFTKVSGAGDTGVWHLMDDKNFYLGRLRMVQNKWVFDPTPKTLELKELAEYFGEVVTAWYE